LFSKPVNNNHSPVRAQICYEDDESSKQINDEVKNKNMVILNFLISL